MGKFYFCDAGTSDDPCHRKYQTAKSWLNHVQKEHNAVNPTLPPMKEFNNKIDPETEQPREGGTFYFCKGGTHSNPCNRKYITSRGRGTSLGEK